ncbi:four helix bundle protein [Prevotella jejuni]|jgi:hypothetical protein|uniref:four helix bundle protein n=1 Tax=Prevotella jejuni TaxID=1177574 RepID=UPI001BA8D3BB|nr:four helix bundle protein [Prevotella jejuni]QUB79017.1 four helix bundle protein [Prevotella jejuni]
MAQYDNLPVFKAIYDLLLDVNQRTRNVPRDLKYTLVQDLKNELVELMVLVYQVNSQREKEQILRRCLEVFVHIRLRIRLLKDMHHLSVPQFAQLCLQTESISKQLTAWHKYSQKGTNAAKCTDKEEAGV